MRQSDYKENRHQNSQRKISDYIKSTLGGSQQKSEPLSNKKNALNELEYHLQQMVKTRSHLSELGGFKESKEIRQSKENKEMHFQFQQQQNIDRQQQLVQTGNFGYPESQLSHRISTQRTLAAFDIHEEIPKIDDLRKLQNWILDMNNFSVEQIDELKKLSSIILFRMRNIRKQ